MKFEVNKAGYVSFEQSGYMGPETSYLEGEDIREMFLSLYKDSIVELVRESYTTGIVDTNGCVEQWCDEDSLERATEILEKFKW